MIMQLAVPSFSQLILSLGISIFKSLVLIMDVMHKADNAYSTQSTWLCYQLVRFLTKHTLVNNYSVPPILSQFSLDVLFSFGFWVWKTSFYPILKSLSYSTGHVEYKLILCYLNGNYRLAEILSR